MLSLQGKTVYLRALEPDDLDFLYTIENDELVWEISGTQAPYSKQVLKRYLENAHLDIYEAKQLRLCICNTNDDTLGLVDLFDFDFSNKRAGVGVIVYQEKHRNKGIGEEVLQLILNYAFSKLGLHQLYANILEGNEASKHLFEKLGFVKAGIKKDWIATAEGFKNEILYQKIK